MAERALRGSRLGSLSYETGNEATELAPRTIRGYACPRGHVTEVPFAAEAEIPGEWQCRSCGLVGKALDGTEPAYKKVKPPRTHWDMLLERRTFDDLEEVLAERMAVLHGDDLRKSA